MRRKINKAKLVNYIGGTIALLAVVTEFGIEFTDSVIDHTKEYCVKNKMLTSLFGAEVDMRHQHTKAFEQISKENYYVYEKEFVRKYTKEEFSKLTKDISILNADEIIPAIIVKTKNIAMSSIERVVNEDGSITEISVVPEGYEVYGDNIVSHELEYIELPIEEVNNEKVDGYIVKNRIQILSKKEELEGWIRLGSYVPNSNDNIFLYKDKEGNIYAHDLNTNLSINNSVNSSLEYIGLLDDENFIKYKDSLLDSDKAVKVMDDYGNIIYPVYNNDFEYKGLEKSR